MNQPESLTIKTSITVLKPPHQVFEAVADPAHMSQYFIAKSTGRMEAGKTVQWQFPEFDGPFPVRVQQVQPNEYLSFYWDDVDGTQTEVEIRLQPNGDSATLVTVTEGSKAPDAAGIGWLQRNTEGWANFLACLKAYLEYGINLRKGAFQPMQMPVKEAEV